MFDSCFYSIGRLKLGIINVKETSLRVRREWVNGQWVQPESYLYVEQPLKQRKMDEAPSIRNEVEVYSLYHRGWIPATILGSVGNKIEVEAWMKKYNETKMWRLYLDVSRMRPRPSMNKDNNWIFRENESVEVLEVNGCWQKGEIWEVHGTGKNLFYSIKAMCEDCIKLYIVSKTEVRVRRKWVGGKWSSSSFEQVSTNDGKGVQASNSKGDHHEEDEFVDTSGEGREFTISAIKEGDTKVGPTLINAHSMLVDGQEKSVEIVIKQGTEVEGISQAPEGYKIPANVAYTFDLICTRYGDIFRNCTVEENLRKLWTIELCGVVHQMEATTYESVSEDMINKWYEVCLGHKELKIDNEWLMNRIGEVKEVVKARMDVLELKNSEKKIIDEIIKIDVECEQLLCKRRKLIEEVRSYERKMKTMTKCHVLGRE
ncbi:uncharacterized protein LOC122093798 [Macadamia integrifolia]|uniref:uncharacterized protein LOC122093798 n=1 Tax=Macadamia integrifolia TaxID=60698 RepID=UPI001C52EED8|nr:uncharacterized protein LOC122093798 [Macadamia integrifolia]